MTPMPSVANPRRTMLRYGPQRLWLRMFLMFGLGAAAALGQAPIGFWPATVFGLAVAMAWLSRGAAFGKVRAFGELWALGAGYFATSLHWIVEPFFVDAAQDGWMAPFAMVFMAGGMALFWGAAGLVARGLGRGTVTPLGLIAALSCVEILRSLAFTGFPWALLGHVWIDTTLARLAAFGGPHLLTLLTLGSAGTAVWVVRRGGVIAFAGLVAFSLAGALALAPRGPVAIVPEADALIIRLVQPNAEQSLKWEPGMANLFFERLLTHTSAGEIPDLVVWPETAVQYLLESSQAQIEAASEAARGAPLITGIVRRGEAGYFNSLVVVGRAGEVTDIYDKHHIVPFGEYFPFAEMLEAWGLGALTGLVGGGYAQGPGPDIVSLPGIGSAIALICYEGIFAEEVNALTLAARPRLIVLITNDAWFGDWAGPAQHFAQSRLRAIEQGLPLVRVANTGISGMIDTQGRITSSLGMGVNGALDVVLPPMAPPPPYTRLGDWPAMALTLLLALITLGRVTRHRNPVS